MAKKKSDFMVSLEKKLKTHWEDTKEEREKTHTARLYHKLDKKKS